MKRIISILCSVLVTLPLGVFAASVTTVSGPTIILPSDGSQYTLSGTFDSVVISGSSFVFTINPGSGIELSSANKKVFTNTLGTATECRTNDSWIRFATPSGSSAQTITITPSGSCAAGSGGSSSAGSDSGSGVAEGGGGGSVSSSAISLNNAASVVSAVAQTQAPTAQPATSPSQTTTSSQSITLTRDLSVGSQGDDVRQLQEWLAKDPALYPGGKVTGYYGAGTREAIRRFQAKYSLSPVGRVGPQTRAKLTELLSGSGSEIVVPSGQPTVPVATPPVSAGVGTSLALGRNIDDGFQGDDVRALQKYLAADSTLYPEGLISGYFGPKTRKAVGRFQEKYGIAKVGDIAYGYVGAKTRAKLLEVSSGGSSGVSQ